MNHIISFAVSAFIILSVAQTQAASAAPDVDRTLALASTGTVRINNVSGSLRVRPWNKAQVRLRATSDSEVKAVVFEPSKDGVEIRVELPRGRVQQGRADLVVDIPATALVVVRGVNLQVDIEQGRDLDVSTVNGDIVARGQSGALRLKTVNGDVTAHGAALKADVDTVNGKVQLKVKRLLGLNLRSVSGSVRVQAAEVASAGHSIRVHSGHIELQLPPTTRVKHRSMTDRRVLGASSEDAPTIDIRSFSSSVDLNSGSR